MYTDNWSAIIKMLYGNSINTASCTHSAYVMIVPHVPLRVLYLHVLDMYSQIYNMRTLLIEKCCNIISNIYRQSETRQDSSRRSLARSSLIYIITTH